MKFVFHILRTFFSLQSYSKHSLMNLSPAHPIDPHLWNHRDPSSSDARSSSTFCPLSCTSPYILLASSTASASWSAAWNSCPWAGAVGSLLTYVRRPSSAMWMEILPQSMHKPGSLIDLHQSQSFYQWTPYHTYSRKTLSRAPGKWREHSVRQFDHQCLAILLSIQTSMVL